MKKIIRNFTLLIATIAFALVGCSTENSTEVNTETSGEGPSVMLLIPGTLGDKSFFDSANDGLALIEENYGSETGVIEMGLDQTRFTSTFEDVIDEGWDIIITGGQQVAPILAEMAEAYPEQQFILYDESLDYSEGNYSNVYSMTYKQYEGAYLAGILAASVTNSQEMPKSNDENIIGFVGGFDIPLINDHLVGLIQGAQEINPDIKFGIGYANSFTDATLGKEIALNLFDSGADVVYQAAGGAGLGALDAAKESDKYAIGTDSDQSELFSQDEAKANSILTSMMKRVDISIDLAIGKYLDDDLAFGEAEAYGIAEKCIELVDNQWYQENVSEDIKNVVSDYYNKISSGEIEVESAFGMNEDEVNRLKNDVEI